MSNSKRRHFDNFDGFVIPAPFYKGVDSSRNPVLMKNLDSGFHWSETFYEIINFDI